MAFGTPKSIPTAPSIDLAQLVHWYLFGKFFFVDLAPAEGHDPNTWFTHRRAWWNNWVQSKSMGDVCKYTPIRRERNRRRTPTYEVDPGNSKSRPLNFNQPHPPAPPRLPHSGSSRFWFWINFLSLFSPTSIIFIGYLIHSYHLTFSEVKYPKKERFINTRCGIRSQNIWCWARPVEGTLEGPSKVGVGSKDCSSLTPEESYDSVPARKPPRRSTT